MFVRTQLHSFLAIDKSETVEVFITDPTVYKYNFPIISNLEGKLIVGIETMTLGFSTIITPANRRLIDTTTTARNCYLTLKHKNGRDSINRVAFNSIDMQTGIIKQLDYMQIDWENSFIEIANNPAVHIAAPAGRSFMFTIYYVDKPSRNALISKLIRFGEIISRMAA